MPRRSLPTARRTANSNRLTTSRKCQAWMWTRLKRKKTVSCFDRVIGLLLTVVGTCAADAEFFEKKIRPLLAEKCYSCHSSKSKVPMGGLRLDTMSAILKGGDTGPAVKPGDKESLLLRAVSY